MKLDYSNKQTMLLAAAIVATIGFLLIPWVFDIPGVQFTLNSLSQRSPMDVSAVMMIIAFIAIIGMFVSLVDKRFELSSAALLSALIVYYITLPKDAGAFLKAGIWVTLIGSIIGIVVVTVFKENPSVK